MREEREALEITIISKRHGDRIIQIDADDFERVNEHTWHLHKMKSKKAEYAMANYGVGLLHRFIMKAHDRQQIDHINGNGLDCRKDNLRLCSNSQNQMNKKCYKKAGLKGVSYDISVVRTKRYKASITINKKKFHLGYYSTEIEGAMAYNIAAVKLHGEFANINQI